MQACLVLCRYQRESRSFRGELLDVAPRLQWRCAALRSPARAGQSHPGSEAGEAGRSLPALYPATMAALEACWLRGRLEASQLGSNGSRKRGCEQIVKFIFFFLYLNQSKYLPGGRPWSCFDALFKTVFAQITQCCFTDLKDTSAGDLGQFAP